MTYVSKIISSMKDKYKVVVLSPFAKFLEYISNSTNHKSPLITLSELSLKINSMLCDCLSYGTDKLAFST